MYSIYVTNKSKKNVYVRLQSQKVSTLNERFHHELGRLVGGRDNSTVDAQPQQSVNSYLVRWGFCNIPAQVTMTFTTDVHNDVPRMYASLYSHSKLWIMDYEVNCARYGCVFVVNKSSSQSAKPALSYNLPVRWGIDLASLGKEEELYLSTANPNPVWIPRKTGESVNDQTLSSIIKAGIDAVEGEVYFGRSSFGGSKPCKVTTKMVDYQHVFDCWKTTTGERAFSGELLKDTGHELVRAKIGDPVPPNAVIAGISETDGTLYLGRVGGNIPCAISTESERIKYFCFNADGVRQVESGEIMLLTK